MEIPTGDVDDYKRNSLKEKETYQVKSDYISLLNFPGRSYADKFKKMLEFGVTYSVIVGNVDLQQ